MRCDVCSRPIRGVHRRLGQTVLCSMCFNRPVVIRTAREERLGSKTFYVRSLLSGVQREYVVKLVRRRLTCNCPDYIHRGQVLREPCKHARLVRMLGRAAGGVRAVPRGVTLSFRLASPARVRTSRRRATR